MQDSQATGKLTCRMARAQWLQTVHRLCCVAQDIAHPSQQAQRPGEARLLDALAGVLRVDRKALAARACKPDACRHRHLSAVVQQPMTQLGSRCSQSEQLLLQAVRCKRAQNAVLGTDAFAQTALLYLPWLLLSLATHQQGCNVHQHTCLARVLVDAGALATAVVPQALVYIVARPLVCSQLETLPASTPVARSESLPHSSSTKFVAAMSSMCWLMQAQAGELAIILSKQAEVQSEPLGSQSCSRANAHTHTHTHSRASHGAGADGLPCIGGAAHFTAPVVHGPLHAPVAHVLRHAGRRSAVPSDLQHTNLERQCSTCPYAGPLPQRAVPGCSNLRPGETAHAQLSD